MPDVATMMEQDGSVRHLIRVRADLLGTVGDAVFAPHRHAERIFSNDQAKLVDIGDDEWIYFTYPASGSVTRAPTTSAFPVRPGAPYVFSGTADVLAGGRVAAYVIWFADDTHLGTNSAALIDGSFTVETSPPAGATKALLAVRVHGPACLALRAIAVHELAALERGVAEVELAEREQAERALPPVDGADERRHVVMIVLNDIVHDGRVLKSARTLLDHGYHVTLLGMQRTRTSTLTVTRAAGARAVVFPNPSGFLRNATVRALTWEHTIAYLRACMWHYVAQANPRFIHTHDYHGVPLGFEFTRRLRALGREVHWLHDFHEYVPGYDHMEPDWQEAVLAHEDRAVPTMDHRFTVSPLIATWLKERHQLAAAPTVVLNAPARRALSLQFDRTVRHDLGLAVEVDLIVYTGGVSELRGVHTVVEALAANPGWHLALVTNNTGPYIERLERLAAEGGYANRLHLLPYVEPHQVSAYVRNASIGIMPFRRYGNTDASLPNKLYDYLHAGLPMVASNCTLIEAFLGKWQIGEVFEVENVAACAATIGRVLADQARYRANLHAHPDLLRECTWEEQAKKIIEAYEMLERPSVLGALRLDQVALRQAGTTQSAPPQSGI